MQKNCFVDWTAFGLILFALLCFGLSGCNFWNSNPNGPESPATSGVVSMEDPAVPLARTVTFRILLPGETMPVTGTDNSSLPAVRGAGMSSVSVTFRLILINIGNSANPTSVLTQTVLPDTSGMARCTFAEVPARTCIGEIHISGGTIASYTDFRGAQDLLPGSANVVDLVPTGSRQAADIIAGGIQELVTTPTLFHKLTEGLYTWAQKIVQTIDLSKSTAATDFFNAFALALPTPPKMLASISLSPTTVSAVTGTPLQLSTVDVRATYSDGSTATVTGNVTWLGRGVSGGTYMAPKAGIATLTCRYAESGVYRLADLTVDTTLGVAFLRASNGVITDFSTGLEWYEGPDRNMSWYDAQSWIQILGAGWRAPKCIELADILVPSNRQGSVVTDDTGYSSSGTLNLDPAFQLNTAYIIYAEESDSKYCMAYEFIGDYLYRYRPYQSRVCEKSYTSTFRAFAVRGDAPVRVPTRMELSPTMVTLLLGTYMPYNYATVFYDNGYQGGPGSNLIWTGDPGISTQSICTNTLGPKTLTCSYSQNGTTVSTNLTVVGVSPSSSSRFSKDSSGVITDSRTGLRWKEHPTGYGTWSDGQTWIKSLGAGWRTPTRLELAALYIPESTRNIDSFFDAHYFRMDPVFVNSGAWDIWAEDKNGSSAWVYQMDRGGDSYDSYSPFRIFQNDPAILAVR